MSASGICHRVKACKPSDITVLPGCKACSAHALMVLGFAAETINDLEFYRLRLPFARCLYSGDEGCFIRSASAYLARSFAPKVGIIKLDKPRSEWQFGGTENSPAGHALVLKVFCKRSISSPAFFNMVFLIKFRGIMPKNFPGMALSRHFIRTPSGTSLNS